MSFEEMVVALVGAVGGIALVAFIFAKTVGLIKAWINRNNTSITERDFDRMAKAFMEHKQDMNRRIQNLEAIIADEHERSSNELSSRTGREEISDKNNTIEIDDDEQQDKSSDNNGNLRNMLHER